MNLVRLGEYGQGVTVSDVGYAEIVALVEKYQICKQCKRKYSKERPKVALNVCLACFLGGYPQMREYIGEKPFREERFFLFLGHDGYVYTSTVNRYQLIQDTYETLRYWHYPVPGEYVNGEERIPFGEASWAIESNFVIITESDIVPAPVAIISYAYRTHGERYFDYICYRETGRVVLLDKHSIAIQRLFTQAREYVKTYMQHPEGIGYQIYADYALVLTDDVLYPVIADMLSKQEIQLEQEN